MSWIDKELKRRQAASGARGAASALDGAEGGSAMVQGLWQQLEETNEALPEELRLPIETQGLAMSPPGGPVFTKWLRASNGAGLGLTADAIRYWWPDRSKGKKSHNFWIVWMPGRGLRVRRRISSNAVVPVMTDAAFDDRSVSRLLRCLVTGKRVTIRSIRRKRLWIF